MLTRLEKQNFWRAKNPEKIAQHISNRKGKAIHSEEKRKARGRAYMRRYGISLNEYETLLQEQLGVCAICGAEPVERSLSVDHNHTTGKVRGLLCAECNLLVGRVEAKMNRVLHCVVYLQTHNN